MNYETSPIVQFVKEEKITPKIQFCFKTYIYQFTVDEKKKTTQNVSAICLNQAAAATAPGSAATTYGKKKRNELPDFRGHRQWPATR